MRINPELLSDKPTHLFRGVKVKVFKSVITGTTAEIMEGPDKGKFTTVVLNELVVL